MIIEQAKLIRKLDFLRYKFKVGKKMGLRPFESQQTDSFRSNQVTLLWSGSDEGVSCEGNPYGPAQNKIYCAVLNSIVRYKLAGNVKVKSNVLSWIVTDMLN